MKTKMVMESQLIQAKRNKIKLLLFVICSLLGCSEYKQGSETTKWFSVNQLLIESMDSVEGKGIVKIDTISSQSDEYKDKIRADLSYFQVANESYKVATIDGKISFEKELISGYSFKIDTITGLNDVFVMKIIDSSSKKVSYFFNKKGSLLSRNMPGNESYLNVSNYVVGEYLNVRSFEENPNRFIDYSDFPAQDVWSQNYYLHTDSTKYHFTINQYGILTSIQLQDDSSSNNLVIKSIMNQFEDYMIQEYGEREDNKSWVLAEKYSLTVLLDETRKSRTTLVLEDLDLKYINGLDYFFGKNLQYNLQNR